MDNESDVGSEFPPATVLSHTVRDALPENPLDILGSVTYTNYQ